MIRIWLTSTGAPASMGAYWLVAISLLLVLATWHGFSTQKARAVWLMRDKWRLTSHDPVAVPETVAHREARFRRYVMLNRVVLALLWALFLMLLLTR